MRGELARGFGPAACVRGGAGEPARVEPTLGIPRWPSGQKTASTAQPSTSSHSWQPALVKRSS